MYSNKRKLSLVVFFLLIIYAPLVGQLLNVGKTGAQDFKERERRAPYTYPGIPKTVSEIKTFPVSFENALNDHLPFRRLLIRLYGELSIKLMGVSPHKKLLLGYNGRCFLAGEGYNDLIFETLEIDSQQIETSSNDLIKKEAFLQDLNVPVLILAIPANPLLEFHNLPRFIQKQIDPSFLKTPPPQRIINNLPERFSKKYLLFPYEKALEANKAYPLIPEKNFHWRSSRYTKLVASCVAERFGIAPYQKPGFDDFEPHQTVSDLSRLAGIMLINRNDVLYKKNIWRSLNIRSKNPAAVYKNYPAGTGQYLVNASKQGTLLLLGDSFAPMLRADLARYFGEVLSINFVEAAKDPNIDKWFQCVFRDIKPDYIVFCYHNKFRVPDNFLKHFYEEQNQLKEQSG